MQNRGNCSFLCRKGVNHRLRFIKLVASDLTPTLIWGIVMKIITVVGARPQFIKAAGITSNKKVHQEMLVTRDSILMIICQRYFREMRIPGPDYNLGISGGTHAQMTGKMLID